VAPCGAEKTVHNLDISAFIVSDWESYLENGEGEFGPFLFAMFDEWLHVPEARDLYQISPLEFENQSSGRGHSTKRHAK